MIYFTSKDPSELLVLAFKKYCLTFGFNGSKKTGAVLRNLTPRKALAES